MKDKNMGVVHELLKVKEAHTQEEEQQVHAKSPFTWDLNDELETREVFDHVMEELPTIVDEEVIQKNKTNSFWNFVDFDWPSWGKN